MIDITSNAAFDRAAQITPEPEQEEKHEVVEFPVLRRHIEIEADRNGFTGQLRDQYIRQRLQQERNAAARESQNPDNRANHVQQQQSVTKIDDDSLAQMMLSHTRDDAGVFSGYYERNAGQFQPIPGADYGPYKFLKQNP